MSLPGRFLNVNGQRVYYHRRNDAGPSAKPLVITHGFMMSHWQWRHVIPTLAQTYDVIAFDLPGFGESDRPAVKDFHYDAPSFMDTLLGVLDALHLEKATLVGHSTGGAISLYTAARRPERVDKLVVIDPLAYAWDMPIEGRATLVPFAGDMLFRAVLSRPVIRYFMKRSIYRDPSLASEEWIDYVWERVNRPGGFAAAHATLRFCADPSAITRSVRAVRAPTMIIWGEDDRLFPPATAQRLAGDIPGAEVAMIPVCGHNPHEERPDEVLAALAPFLGLGGVRGLGGKRAAG